MQMRWAPLVLVSAAMLAALTGCGESGHSQAAKDACGDLRKAAADYNDGNIDAATYLGLLGVVAQNAAESEETELIGAGIPLQTSLLAVDDTETLNDLAVVGSRARDMGDACDGLGL